MQTSYHWQCPASHSGAIYAARAGLDPVQVLGYKSGTTHEYIDVENYSALKMLSKTPGLWNKCKSRLLK